MRNLLLFPLAAIGLLFRHASPSTFRVAPGAHEELQHLWAGSIAARVERVACLASTIAGDTLVITHIQELDDGDVDSLAVRATASLDVCGPPAWQGTVHTHIALYDGQRPYSRFSGADRGVMSVWWQHWKTQGTFCLLFGESNIHCELDGPSGSLIFPSTTY